MLTKRPRMRHRMFKRALVPKYNWLTLNRTNAERTSSTTTENNFKTEEASVTDKKHVSFPQSQAAQNLDLVGIGAQFQEG
jgi:hypothetical protein